MASVICNSLEIEYERIGEAGNPVVLLIAGLGFQMIDWPLDMCKKLAAAGYQVIRFDNRDIGLSEKLSASGIPDIQKILHDKGQGKHIQLPYQLEDMAKDVSELLKALDISAAHIVGMSMGGMIAQIVAASFPEQTLSLTSIMSSSSDPSLPGPTDDASTILASAPASQNKEDIVAFGLKVNEVIGSPGFRWPLKLLQAHIEACIERSYCPDGYMRQYAAVLAAGSRVELLHKISVPTLVIHGSNDPLVQPVCGRNVADHVTGSRYVEVSGMGHDLSPALCAHLADLLLDHLKSHQY
ncbi:alpha/beta fold hydrolase [Sneathiella glossodoripedis]|uniref:alpha/beta fold hydrolase n=1 Tax=Sneathiella glossodoripedis TaxID=418853 RepID=UPI00046FF1C7|nr:alpha/beta hydrolase [Sneathiella glossodoripedis]